MEDEEMNGVVMGIYCLLGNIVFGAYKNMYEYLNLLESVLTIGKYYFTWEQIEQAYLEKNEVNHKRQESGY